MKTIELEVITIHTCYGATQLAIVLDDFMLEKGVKKVYMNQNIYYLVGEDLEDKRGNYVGTLHKGEE